MKDFRPIPTTKSTLFVFSGFSLVFILTGVYLYVQADKVLEFFREYDKECFDYLPDGKLNPHPVADPKSCFIFFHEVPASAPNETFFAYYGLTKFY